MVLTVNIYFFYGLAVGFVAGLVTALFFGKKIELEKLVSIIVIMSWLLLHFYGFSVGRDVPFIFDVVGGASVGHLIGFDLAEAYKKFKK